MNSRTEYERDKQNLIEIKRGISGSEGKEKHMGVVPWNCSCGDECGGLWRRGEQWSGTGEGECGEEAYGVYFP